MKDIWLIYYDSYISKNRYFIDEIINEGKKSGLNVRLVTVEDLDNNMYDNLPDAVIMRAINPELSMKLEDMGIRLFNNASVSVLCNNKAETIRRVHKLGIIHIPTITVSLKSSAKDFQFSYEYICSPFLEHYNDTLTKLNENILDDIFMKNKCADIDLSKYVIKSVTGHGGREVMLLSDFYLGNGEFGAQERDASSFYSDKYIIQPLMSEYMSDIRVYIIDGKIIGAVKRSAGNGFKSNYSLGGRVCLFTPEGYMYEYIGKILTLCDFSYIGIDFLYSSEGRPVFNEIEDVVGARMLSECGVDDYVRKYMEYIRIL